MTQSIQFDLQQLKGKLVAVFGDYMVDEYLQGSASRISPEAPVPIVKLNARKRCLGGAANVVRNLCALDASVRVLGYTGCDEAGNWLVAQMGSNGADVNCFQTYPSATTIIKTRITSQNQQLLRIDEENVVDAPEEFLQYFRDHADQIFQGVGAVIISDYGKGAVTLKNAHVIIREAANRNIPVIVDPKGSDYSKYAGATVCTPNMKEFQEATAKSSIAEDDFFSVGSALCAKNHLQYLLVTRSEKGMTLIDHLAQRKLDYPAVAKEVVDVTGAGDTVAAVFALCMAAGAELSECCYIANLAASIVVSKFGASVATRQEIRALIAPSDVFRNKVLSLAQAEQQAALYREQGKRVVFTNGCFDLVHAGHISSFRKAKQLGDALFVGVNSDDSIKRLKGPNRPIVDQQNRLTLLQELNSIDYLVVFDEDTPEALIQTIKPDILIKGKDWEGKKVAGAEFVEKNGGQVCLIDLEKGLSTSDIIDRIIRLYGGKQQ